MFINWNEEGYPFSRVGRHLHGTKSRKKAILCILLQRTLNNIMDSLGARELLCISKGVFCAGHPGVAAYSWGTRPTLQLDLLTRGCHSVLQSARRATVRRKSEVTLKEGLGVRNEVSPGLCTPRHKAPPFRVALRHSSWVFEATGRRRERSRGETGRYRLMLRRRQAPF